jgi:hypothetical protein
MSRNETTAASLDLARTGMKPPAPARSMGGPWVWTAIACITLGASGVVRAVQERRHQDEMNYRETCPIALTSLPSKLGGWRLVPGGERPLDDLTFRITGGTDYLQRNYVDDLTGVSLMVFILFGPAEPVLPHTPEVCFPSMGYTPADDASDRMIKADDGTAAEFRSLVYAKPGGRTMLREEAYYSFRLEGRWSANVGAGRKFPRRNPSVFKVQVQRRVAEGEHRDRDEPIEQFLKLLIPEIERRLAAAANPAGSPKTSMGGLGSAPVGGEPRPGVVPSHLGYADLAAVRPAGRPEDGSPREPRRALGQHRRPSDRADDQYHRHQVEGERDLDREPDRVNPSPPARSRGDLIVGYDGTVRNGDHQPRS